MNPICQRADFRLGVYSFWTGYGSLNLKLFAVRENEIVLLVYGMHDLHAVQCLHYVWADAASNSLLTFNERSLTSSGEKVPSLTMLILLVIERCINYLYL